MFTVTRNLKELLVLQIFINIHALINWRERVKETRYRLYDFLGALQLRVLVHQSFFEIVNLLRLHLDLIHKNGYLHLQRVFVALQTLQSFLHLGLVMKQSTS